MHVKRKYVLPVLYWVTAGCFYVWFFGRTAPTYSAVLTVTGGLLVIAMGTAWVLGSVLLPRFLLTGRRLLFWLYTTYTLVISVYLVLVVIVGDFMLADYAVSNMTPAALDRPGLLIGVYVVVATWLIIQLVSEWDQLQSTHREVEAQFHTAAEKLREAERALAQAGDPLEIQVDRRTVRIDPASIQYLESAGDYVLVTTDVERHITKARLSEFADRLARRGFLRVHRSFVVRLAAVDAFSLRQVTIGDAVIPVGRTYRPAVRDALAV